MAQGTINKELKMIVIGGSAGSLDVLLHVLPLLKIDFEIPIVVVVHRKNPNDPTLSNLLSTKSNLQVKEIEEKESINPGHIYIVPGDYHLLFEKDYTFSLDYSERVNYSRPSIDVVFQSAADIFGQELTCILLSGANADGTAGLIYAKNKGATTIAQSPSSADVAYMPEHAIANNAVHFVLNVDEIAGFLNKL